MSKKIKTPIPSKSRHEPSNRKVSSQSISSDKIYWILLGVAILIFSYIRLRLSNMPFERDEGEYAYMGNLLLEGLLPYRDAYNMKLPGTYFMYAVIELFFGKLSRVCTLAFGC